MAETNIISEVDEDESRMNESKTNIDNNLSLFLPKDVVDEIDEKKSEKDFKSIGKPNASIEDNKMHLSSKNLQLYKNVINNNLVNCGDFNKINQNNNNFIRYPNSSKFVNNSYNLFLNNYNNNINNNSINNSINNKINNSSNVCNNLCNNMIYSNHNIIKANSSNYVRYSRINNNTYINRPHKSENNYSFNNNFLFNRSSNDFSFNNCNLSVGNNNSCHTFNNFQMNNNCNNNINNMSDLFNKNVYGKDKKITYSSDDVIKNMMLNFNSYKNIPQNFRSNDLYLMTDNSNFTNRQNIFQNKITSFSNNIKDSINNKKYDAINLDMQKDQNDNPKIVQLIEKMGKNSFIGAIKTNKGSRYFQKLLSKCHLNKTESAFITNTIGDNFNEVICDYYGNYFLQKLFPQLNDEDRLRVYSYIKDNFIQVANDISGNHSLQCLIMLENTFEEKQIIKNLIMNNLQVLAFNQNGSNIIEKIVISFKESERDFLNSFLINNFIDLSLDVNGNKIIKQFVIYMKNEYYIKSIIKICETNTNILSTNQNGSEIIQKVIEIFGYNYCKKIVRNLINKIVNYSISKHSSNIIIFLLSYFKNSNFQKFVECLNIIFLDENNYKEMIRNKFSSFVIEKAFILIDEITPNYFNKKNYNISNLDSESESDISDDEGEEDNKKNKNAASFKNMDYNKFLDFRNQILAVFENNSSKKEKRKILNIRKSK